MEGRQQMRARTRLKGEGGWSGKSRDKRSADNFQLIRKGSGTSCRLARKSWPPVQTAHHLRAPAILVELPPAKPSKREKERHLVEGQCSENFHRMCELVSANPARSA